MNAIETNDHLDAAMDEALGELRAMILSRYPRATFSVRRGDDPAGIHLLAEVDVNDLTDILFVVLDRLVDMQVEEGLPIYLVPTRPIHREIANLRRSNRAVGKDRESVTGDAQ